MEIKLLIPILFLLLISAPINTFANTKITYSKTSTNHYIQPLSNITGYKYKTENGKVWKRLWSYTYNRWEDPKWIPL